VSTPAVAPAGLAEKPADARATEDLYARLLGEVYGLQLAAEGLLDPRDAVVSVVRPGKGGFNVGLMLNTDALIAELPKSETEATGAGEHGVMGRMGL